MIGNSTFLRNLRKFRLVTFDITETLLCFRQAPAIQYAKTAAELGVTDIDQPLLEQCFKDEFKTMAKLYPNYGRYSQLSWYDWWAQLVERIFHCVKPNIDEKKLKQISGTLIKIYRTNECWIHIDGNKELLSRVRQANKHVGVISNSDPSLHKVLKEMEILDKFDFVLTSYEAGYQKPDRSIYDIPLEKYGVKADEALHIGNTYDLDYIGARNAGWSSLLVTRNKIDLERAQSTHAYPSLKDLLLALDTKEIQW
uniref:Putative hydrolase n=1 Tax=Glossina morsitans morsitans TaxID=37546 RepID=D3TNS2_GLOMM